MTPEQIEAAAEALLQAESRGRQIGLLSQQNPHAGLDQAYAMQAALIRRQRAAGRVSSAGRSA